MSGRTTWWAKDAAWWRRGRIVKLGREFGPAGPAVIDVLMGEAKQQGPSKGHDGSVKADVASLSMCAFIDDDALVQAIVEKAAQIGLLDDFEDLGDGLFTCRMSGWQLEQEIGVAAIRRERRVRPYIPTRVRRRVLDRGPCVTCGITDDIQVDHIVPWSCGGSDDESNLQPMCGPCNRRKGARHDG